ncbi:MAG TPA: S46 family peptidase [Pyrinomonadaceae bacterium]|nr:S46 family peptidase [Pyrinomonadaceae bacterium]
MAFRKTVAAALVAFHIFAPLPAAADEGLWTLNGVPAAQIEKRHRIKLGDELLQRLRRATVRLPNGGTGAFVSADGLLLTNQHVAQDYVQKISSVQNNYVKDGYLARERGAELKLPGVEVRVLERQEDVTARVNGAVKEGMPAAEATGARRRESVRIVQETDKAGGLTSDVLSHFRGLKHTLYSYKVYRDVRLVFIPEREVANFGGDDDNYRYPRFWLDAALLRVYEDDKPLRTESHLAPAAGGASEGAAVVVAGYPLTTERYLTAAHLEYLTRTELPLVVKRLRTQLAALRAFAALGEAEAVSVQTQIFDAENTIKALSGRVQGLSRPGVLEARRRGEQEWRRQAARRPGGERYERAFAAVEKARRDLNAYEAERRLLDDAWAFETAFFRAAREHVRLAQERAKPPEERMAGFDDAFLARLEAQVVSGAPKKSKFEELRLANSLALLKEALGDAHPAVKAALAGKSPAERAAELMSQTRLDDVGFRKSLAGEGLRGLEASTDPMIVLARWADAEALRLRRRYQAEVVEVEGESYPLVEEALHALLGEGRYPDANFTLRLSVGRVAGYSEGGKKLPPFTYLDGLFDRARRHGNKPPYQLTERWLARRATLKPETPFNFVTTNDVVGGNSGSPVVNERGELLGIVFDSNEHALVGRYLYDGERGRAIVLDVRALLAALRHVYGADPLLAELGRG